MDTLTEQPPTEPQVGPAPTYPAPQEFGNQGQTSYDQQERTNLTNAGFSECAHPNCGFMHAPGLSTTQTCPNCQTTPEMADQMGSAQMQMQMGPGGATRSGLSLREQGDLGEDVIRKLGYLPGYGAITWWHEKGGTDNGALDGGTNEWGIEVRGYNVDNAAIQFNLTAGERDRKNAQAQEMGYKGILAIVVTLDFRRSLADIYVRPFLMEARDYRGVEKFGVGFYRPSGPYKLLEEVPFDNPFMLPSNQSVPEMNDTHEFEAGF
jgi:hypothetical protein